MNKDLLPREDAVTWIAGALLYLLIAAGMIWAGHTALAGASQREPVEYYSSFAGHRHPVRMVGRIDKEEAERVAARGAAYYIANFDDARRLVSVVKRYRGRVLFQYVYVYDANGAISLATIANEDGEARDITFAH